MFLHVDLMPFAGSRFDAWRRGRYNKLSTPDFWQV